MHRTFPSSCHFFYKYPVIVHHIHPKGDGYQNQQNEVDPEGFFEKGGHVVGTKLRDGGDRALGVS